mmetsp:Transcript_42571/g.120784  ORF Transcript_42571/g.120784 Transcript_42571/m.120784 type:complete len:90 (-) Transcript_42571:370-639(-)
MTIYSMSPSPTPADPTTLRIPFHRTVNRHGKAAALAEKDKIDKYGPTARAAGFRFVPLAAGHSAGGERKRWISSDARQVETPFSHNSRH